MSTIVRMDMDIERACSSLWVKLVRADNSWYGRSSGQWANRSTPDPRYNPCLPSNSCLLWLRRSLRRTESHGEEPQGVSKVDNLWFHFILDLIFLWIPRILCHNLWTVWLRISPQCPGISHPAFLISQRDHTHKHTHMHAHIRFVKWGQRSESVFRQLIIFPAPERDGWRKVLAFSKRGMTQMKLLTPHHTLIWLKSISFDK